MLPLVGRPPRGGDGEDREFAVSARQAGRAPQLCLHASVERQDIEIVADDAVDLPLGVVRSQLQDVLVVVEIGDGFAEVRHQQVRPFLGDGFAVDYG
ncbi:hypothetical protein ACNS7O_00265 [Haloferacaceae archaeon DSL9]